MFEPLAPYVRTSVTSLEAAVLRDMFELDGDGVLVWKRTTRIGRPAGNANGRKGYFRVTVMGISFQLHRVVWAFVTGSWPKGQIDHIDGDKSNNRPSNLRVVSNAINQQNQYAPRRDNKVGFRGVMFHKGGKRRRRFVARIWVDGKCKFLGHFVSAEEAKAAYLRAKLELHSGAVAERVVAAGLVI